MEMEHTQEAIKEYEGKVHSARCLHIVKGFKIETSDNDDEWDNRYGGEAHGMYQPNFLDDQTRP